MFLTLRYSTSGSPTSEATCQDDTAVRTIYGNGAPASSTNPLDSASFFVREQYYDFLNRLPDQDGLAYWTNEINKCGTDAVCVKNRRRDVSAAFFIEQEFQNTGFYVYRMNKATLGASPTFSQYVFERGQMGAGTDQDKANFTALWVRQPDFIAKYPASQSGSEFIDALLATVKQSSGLDLTAKRFELMNEYMTASTQNESRARVIRKVVEYADYMQAEYNRAFVLAEYFGYLQHDPDTSGYNFWLNVLNNKVPGNYKSMVCAFITSREYQGRFSSVISHSDAECGS